MASSEDQNIKLDLDTNSANDLPQPTATSGGYNGSYVLGSNAVSMTDGAVISGASGGMIQSLVIQATNGWTSDDTVGWTANLGSLGLKAATSLDGKTWTFTPTSGGEADASKFEAVLNSLTFSSKSETTGTRSFTFTVTDLTGKSNLSSDYQIAVFNLAPSNSAPTGVKLTAAAPAIDENTVIGTGVKVADIEVVDDGKGTNTLSLDGADAASFKIVGNALYYIGSSPDFESGKKFYDVSVLVQDLTIPGSKAVSVPYTLTVTDINEAPTALTLNTSAVNENDAGAVVATDIRADDQDTPASGFADYTYKVLADDGSVDARFVYDAASKSIKLAAGVSLDFENPGDLTLRLQATNTDNSAHVITKSFTVDLKNVNEAPTNVALSGDSVNENAEGAVIGTLTTTDPDADDTVTYTVNDDRFEVVNGQLKLKAGTSLDFETESKVNVTVTAKDSGGLTKDQAFEIEVKDVNEAPTKIELAGDTVDENVKGAVIGTLTTTDPDANDTFTYTVSDDRFEVVNGELKLKDDAFLNFEDEQSVEVSVTAKDSGGLEKTETFQIKVTDANDAPTDVDLSGVKTSIDENNAGPVDLGAIVVVDQDTALGENTLSLEGTDKDSFQIDKNGHLWFVGSANFEGKASYDVTVVAADATIPAQVTKDFHLTIGDVNEAPTSLTVTAVSVNENDVGAVVATVSIVDPDSAVSGFADYTYKVLADDGSVDARFIYDAASKSIKLAAGVSLDFENPGDLSLHLQATNTNNPAHVISSDFTVDLKDLKALFTAGNDERNFNEMKWGDYEHDVSQYNALSGDDVVYLPNSGLAASEWGWDFGRTFEAGSGNDKVIGGNGNDIVSGGSGNDWLKGGLGDDRLVGAEGNDIIVGGMGADKMTGSSGKDVFVFNSAAEIGTQNGAHDVITDFAQKEDVIDLSGIFAGNGLVKWVGNKASVGLNEVGFYTLGGKTFVIGNDAGKGFAIELSGAYKLTAADVLLPSAVVTSEQAFKTATGLSSADYAWLHI